LDGCWSLHLSIVFHLQNEVFCEWAMPYRTSDLCRVKAKLTRSLWFVAIRFQHF
jgi:hypothetical protein